ncbi:MAG: hypothetical protein CMF51_02055 [Legionellales bacterium]|nr:hypothetical protein [Legionellales bacterium]|tara:strand:- start:140 stop:1606 length:1467 start_codon:yes stop_codon:yes gene_type:complete
MSVNAQAIRGNTPGTIRPMGAHVEIQLTGPQLSEAESKNLVFIVDNSGSMGQIRGQTFEKATMMTRIDATKQALIRSLETVCQDALLKDDSLIIVQTLGTQGTLDNAQLFQCTLGQLRQQYEDDHLRQDEGDYAAQIMNIDQTRNWWQNNTPLCQAIEKAGEVFKALFEQERRTAFDPKKDAEDTKVFVMTDGEFDDAYESGNLIPKGRYGQTIQTAKQNLFTAMERGFNCKTVQLFSIAIGQEVGEELQNALAETSGSVPVYVPCPEYHVQRATYDTMASEFEELMTFVHGLSGPFQMIVQCRDQQSGEIKVFNDYVRTVYPERLISRIITITDGYAIEACFICSTHPKEDASAGQRIRLDACEHEGINPIDQFLKIRDEDSPYLQGKFPNKRHYEPGELDLWRNCFQGLKSILTALKPRLGVEEGGNDLEEDLDGLIQHIDQHIQRINSGNRTLLVQKPQAIPVVSSENTRAVATAQLQRRMGGRG